MTSNITASCRFDRECAGISISHLLHVFLFFLGGGATSHLPPDSGQTSGFTMENAVLLLFCESGKRWRRWVLVYN